MKKNLSFIVIISLSLLLLFGCSPIGVTIRGQGGAQFIGNVIAAISPLQLGPATSVTIGNVSPSYYYEVIILDKTFRIPPSGAIYDRWAVEWDHSVLPVTIRVFSDRNYLNLIGHANRVLGIGLGQPTLWFVGLGDVCFLDGQRGFYNLYASPYPQADISSEREVNIPTIKEKSMNVGEIINGTLFDVVVREGGIKGKLSDLISPASGDKVLKSGDIYRMKTISMYDNGKLIRYVLIADRGRYVGYAGPFEFNVSTNGPNAQQYLITPDMIRRF
ncbi:MAG: hypothetical protein AAB572_00835 [Patescibacteria group bacterium]